MNLETALLNRLKAGQAEFALESLKRPSNRDLFQYGFCVGQVAGVEFAINLLLSILEEEKHSDNDI